MRDQVGAFRAKAAAHGFSADEVQRWAELARPVLRLTLHGGGPVVGRFGGPLLLPADVPDPGHPYVATLDLTALSAEDAGLPLPSDGHLLLFAFPEHDSWYADVGSAVFVPAGAAVVERDRDFSWHSSEDDYRELLDQYPQGELHATADVSLPHFCDESFSHDLWKPEWPPYEPELVELFRTARAGTGDRGTLQVGGYASEEVVDVHDPITSVIAQARRALQKGKVTGPVSEDAADWVLLADWHTDIDGWEGATVHWAVQRDDLVARRFDRVFTTRYWNP
ncbi:hypothetical protein BBK82_34275 [Lentzea guizhouensis]|uniref:DUF1963 domain-containing protein n=1 Tax=Lentzea guizhouensis TaxID=1586287 RepID=A0A1B2HZV5_9PSEU|nr:hypothetical protein BBK82_34275 [Lentzea guizhouensis]